MLATEILVTPRCHWRDVVDYFLDLTRQTSSDKMSHNQRSMCILVYCKTRYIFEKTVLSTHVFISMYEINFWLHDNIDWLFSAAWSLLFLNLLFAIWLNRLKIVLNTVLYSKPHTHMVLNSYWLIRMWTSRDFDSYLLNENSRGNWIDDDIPEVIRSGQMMLDEVKS